MHAEIGLPLADWITAQRMFFVATAPLAADGLMNCSPKGMDSFRILSPPQIVRLHGRGTVVLPGDARYELLRPEFPDYPGTRAIISATIDRVSDSCGFAVPRYDFVDQRDTLVRWSEKKGVEGLHEYRRDKNTRSITGLPGISD